MFPAAMPLGAMLFSALSLVLASASAVVLDGAILDVTAIGAPTPTSTATAALVSHRGRTRVEVIRDATGRDEVVRTIKPPRGTLAAAGCGPRGVIFVDRRGVVDENGARLLDAAPLFGGGRPDVIRFFPLCAPTGEVRLPTATGFSILPGSGAPYPLTYPHVARSYGDRGGAGLLRSYAAAWTTYLPLTFDANVDDDSALEFVVVSETHVDVFDRGDDGRLRPKPTKHVPLRQAFAGGISPGASTRVVLGDLDRDGRDEVVVTQFESPFSKRSSAGALRLTATGAERVDLYDDEGFSVVLAVHAGQLLRAKIDTSVVALTGALLSGEVSVLVESVRDSRSRVVVETALRADIPRGKLLGSLPQWVDGDGAILVQDPAGKMELRSGPSFNVVTRLSEETAALAFALPGGVVVATPMPGNRLRLSTSRVPPVAARR